MAGTSNSITTHNVLNGVLNADNVISGLVNTAFNPAYALVTQAGAQIVLFINSSDYKMYAQLKDKSGNLIYTSNIIDLPLETMVVDGRYDSGTKKLILVLDNGNEIEVPLGALISGLVNENDLVANYYDKDEIDVLLDGYWTKIELTQEDIDNWNAKQEYLNQGDGIEISADTILKGNTYQESTTGKNLLKNTNVNSGDNNYWNSYSIYDEETGTLTRSTTETTENYISHRINLKNDTKYTISCLAKSNGYVSSLDIYAYNSTTTKVYSRADISLTTNFQKYSFTFTTDSSTDFTNAAIRFDNNGSTQSGTEATLTIKDVMLVEGEDTEFEPYTNGASPNPDYPQDIHVVSGDNTINVVGKNLLPNNGITETKNGITFTKNADNTITLNGTAIADTYTDVWYNTTSNLVNNTNQIYTMSIGLSNSNVGLAIFEYINNDWVNKKYVYTENTTYTPSGNQTGQIFRIIVKNGAVLNNVIVKPMLEKGSSASDFEQYVGNTYSINLPNAMELCKIGNYQDYIYKDNGSWYLHKEIGKTVITSFDSKSGTNNNYMYSTTTIDNIKRPSGGTVVSSILATHGISKAPNTMYLNDTTGVGVNTSGTIAVAFGLSSTLTTKELANNWVASNNITTYYRLDTPTNTEITDSTLISQLNALTIGFSNNWVENVSQTNADLPFEIEYDNKNLTISASSNLVRNTDYATSNTGGVIKIGYYNFNISEGRPYVTTTSYADYQNLGNGAFIGKGTLENVITGKALETTNNKVTSISSSSTDTQYPSAKCIYDLIGNLETILTTLDIGTGVE